MAEPLSECLDILGEVEQPVARLDEPGSAWSRVYSHSSAVWLAICCSIFCRREVAPAAWREILVSGTVAGYETDRRDMGYQLKRLCVCPQPFGCISNHPPPDALLSHRQQMKAPSVFVSVQPPLQIAVSGGAASTPRRVAPWKISSCSPANIRQILGLVNCCCSAAT